MAAPFKKVNKQQVSNWKAMNQTETLFSETWILGIETSTSNCSVALFKGDLLMDSVDEDTGNYHHSERLHPLIDQLLKKHGLEPAALGGIAMGLGPGSYTGLRIGASTAKGIAFALNIPIVGVSSLELLTVGMEGTRVDAVLDARRMEVYTAAYHPTSGEELTAPYATIIEADYLKDVATIDRPLTIVGDCVEKMRTLLGEDRFVWVHKKPTASDLGPAIKRAWGTMEFLDAAYFEPLYVKPYRAIKTDKGRLQSLKPKG